MARQGLERTQSKTSRVCGHPQSAVEDRAHLGARGMARGIAHELNQPLGAIATFSQAGDRLLNRSEPQVTRALDVFRQINSEALGAGEGIRRIRRLVE